MGRPKKPTALKILQGTFRKDRDGDPADVAADGIPVPPPHLKPAALDFWKQVVPGLIASGVAKERDSPQLAIMCEWWAHQRRFQELLSAAKDEDKRLHSLTVMLAIATDKFNTVASRFGLTPADRAKLRSESKAKGSSVVSRKREA